MDKAQVRYTEPLGFDRKPKGSEYLTRWALFFILSQFRENREVLQRRRVAGRRAAGGNVAQ